VALKINPHLPFDHIFINAGGLAPIARQDGLLQESYRHSAIHITGKEKGEMGHAPFPPFSSPLNPLTKRANGHPD